MRSSALLFPISPLSRIDSYAGRHSDEAGHRACSSGHCLGSSGEVGSALRTAKVFGASVSLLFVEVSRGA